DPPYPSRMADELMDELGRMNLQGDLITMVLKQETSSIISAGAPVMVLPMELMETMLQKGELGLEGMAAGLRASIEKLQPFGPTMVLAESILCLARSVRSNAGTENRLQIILMAIGILRQLGARHRLGRAYTDLATVLKDGDLLYDALQALEMARDVAS